MRTLEMLKLNENTLKEMMLSFKLTEERESAARRGKPMQTQVPPPPIDFRFTAPKPKQNNQDTLPVKSEAPPAPAKKMSNVSQQSLPSVSDKAKINKELTANEPANNFGRRPQADQKKSVNMRKPQNKRKLSCSTKEQAKKSKLSTQGNLVTNGKVTIPPSAQLSKTTLNSLKDNETGEMQSIKCSNLYDNAAILKKYTYQDKYGIENLNNSVSGEIFSRPKTLKITRQTEFCEEPLFDFPEEALEPIAFPLPVELNLGGTVTKVPAFEGMFANNNQETSDFLIVNEEDTNSYGVDDYQLCRYFENSLKTNNVLAVIKNDIEFYGTVTVTLLCGQVAINGYKARKSEPLTIYSPKGFPWVVISPVARKEATEGYLNIEEFNEAFSMSQLENITNNYDCRRDAIVLLQRNSGADKMLNNFTKHMAENVFPQVNSLPTNRPLYASECLLHCLIQSADNRSGVKVPTPWTQLALHENSRLMVTGGKSVGKSTLLRYLINNHLRRFTRMLFIDLDIGQPELFVSQTISCSVVDGPLLGPGFFLNKQPDKAYLVGHVNIVMCAVQYLRAVRQLLQHCQKNARYAGMPWLINTMGYNKGFGLELMTLLINYVQPSDVVQIVSANDMNNFDEPLEWQTLSDVQRIIYTADEFKTRGLPQYTLHQFRSVVPQQERNGNGWNMSAKDVRYVNLLARLSAAMRGNAQWLMECQPVHVPLSELKIMHLTSTDNTRDELIAGMEANVVFLCQQGPGTNESTPDCIGIGVVRAIDYKSNKLYLVPAMPLERLSKVNCLVLGGDLTLPQGYFKEQGPGVTNDVPFVFTIDDCKSSKSIRQIYFRAPEFLGSKTHKAVVAAN